MRLAVSCLRAAMNSSESMTAFCSVRSVPRSLPSVVRARV
jgi:hypothetical protein